jgi:AcrR family transcriptional regulator
MAVRLEGVLMPVLLYNLVMSTDYNSVIGVRERLVDAAIRVLVAEGPSAVQARRVAKEIGASTMAVYHYFGGMPELMRAVSEEGYRRLGRQLVAQPPTDDPVADICTQALTYRHHAHESRHLYDVMTGPSAAPVAAGGAAASEAFSGLVATVARTMEAGRIRPGAPELVAAQFWSILHGYVTLELAGQFAHLDDPVTEILVPLGVNVLIGLGDDPERAAASARLAGMWLPEPQK